MRKVAIFVALLLAGCNETSLPNIVNLHLKLSHGLHLKLSQFDV